MSPSQGGGDGRVLRRRSVLKRLGTAGVVAGTAGCIDGGGGGQETTTTDTAVTFGLTTSESGPYNKGGAEEERGFDLAVEHLNDGGGLVDTDAFEDLSGNGVLGREVDTTVHDTGGSAQEVDEIARSFERNDDVVMYTGGLDAGVVLGLRDAADEHEIPYMAGPTTLDAVTGQECSRYVFRELFSSTAIARALVPTLVNGLGEGNAYYHISVDAPAGDDLKSALDDHLSDETDWQATGSSATVPGSTNFEDQIQLAEGTVPDVLFLNLFGLDAANALNQAADQLSDSIDVVVPFLDRTVAETVSDNVANVLGTVPWIHTPNDQRSMAFEEAYEDAYGGDTPSGIAHHTYVQTLQYAAAAERAGSFDSDDVVSALRGHRYDVGIGEQELRACDHQGTRPVTVVRGRLPSEQGSGRYLNRLNVAEAAIPNCDEPPAANCSL